MTSRLARRALVAAALVVVVAAVGFTVSRTGSSETGGDEEGARAASITTTSAFEGTQTPEDRPPPGIGAQAEPLGSPPPLPAEAAQMKAGRDYQYITTQYKDPEDPVAYDPCRPIHYVINDRTAPKGSDRVLHEAIDEVSRATGLTFVDDGASDEVPVWKRPLYQPKRYGDRWAPVLIAWSDQAELDVLNDASFGSGGSYGLPDPDSGKDVYVTGIVALNGPAIEADLATFPQAERTDRLRAVLMHYMAHIVGLTHTDQVNNILYHGHDGRATEWAPGDLAGLATEGVGICAPAL